MNYGHKVGYLIALSLAVSLWIYEPQPIFYLLGYLKDGRCFKILFILVYHPFLDIMAMLLKIILDVVFDRIIWLLDSLKRDIEMTPKAHACLHCCLNAG